KTMVFLNLLVPVISFVNQLTDGNYLYLHHKPETASLLDFLGPYPWYILSLEAVAFTLSLLVWLLFRKRASTIVVNKDFQHYV
ncbi:MAG TPA: TIGR02206 family membrane protein, partial [Pseudobacillus sp.]